VILRCKDAKNCLKMEFEIKL